MRWLIPLVALGCKGGPQPATVDPGRNGLRVVVSKEAPEPGDEVTLQSLQITVSGVVLEADTPQGAISVETATPMSGDLVTGPVSTTLDLETGTYEDVEIRAEIDGAPGMVLEATIEGTRFTLVVSDPVVLTSSADELIIAAGPDQEVWFVLHPSDWLSELSIEDLAPPGGPWTVSATENPDAYAELLEIIEDSEGNLGEDSKD